MRSITTGLVCAVVCLCALSNPVCAQIQGMQLLPEGFGENPGIEAKADKILKDMCSYVGGLQQFSIEVESVFEIVLGSGQKVQFCSQGDVRLKRPNKLRVDRKGQFADVAFYYDGKSVTVFAKRKGYYATTPAPATLDETFDTARDDFGLVAPAADLFYSDAYDGLIKQLGGPDTPAIGWAAGIERILLALDEDEFLTVMLRWLNAFVSKPGQTIPGVPDEMFDNITVPTLIIRGGENDWDHPKRTSLEVSCLIKGSTLIDPPWPEDAWERAGEAFARSGGKSFCLFDTWVQAAPAILDFLEA